jgi:predicted nucleotidyltransferase
VLSELDLSEWSRRDAAAARASGALRARVETALPELRAILADHGVTEAFLFGSLLSGSPRPGADVDIAVAGCPPARFYRLGAQLERALRVPLDLIDLDRAPNDFAAPIRSRGRRFYPAASRQGADDQG